MTLKNIKVLVAAAALSASAYAQSKAALYEQMNSLNERAIHATASGNHALASQLKTQVQAISAQLGGMRPELPASMVAANPVVVGGGAQFAVEPANCQGAPATTYAAVAGTTGAIPDVTISTFTAAVSGVALGVWDVDLNVNITHTWNADLEISLFSPLGTQVIVSDNRGGAADDVFNGTLFDDQSANPIGTYAFTSGVAAPDLRPDNSLNNGFRGENANGTWTLQVDDQVGGDLGNLSAWSLTITDGTFTTPPGPPTGFNGPYVFTDSPNMAIVDLATSTDTMTVSGCVGNLYEVEVYTEITHTWNSDLLISVISPAGSSRVLSNRWGGANDDVFNGTLFDEDSLNPIATYAFTNAVAAPDLNPDGDLKNYWFGCGEDPNGTWSLEIQDLAGADIGNLARWDLKITTGVTGCGSAVANYCTSSTTTNSCNPAMSASAAIASIGAGPGSFVLTANSVEGQKSGLVFYGITGQNNLVWGSGSTSFLCVKAPTQRGPTANSGGTAGACDGSLSLDFFAFMAGNPSALGQPIAAGQVYDAQAWFRDPPAPKTTNLSDGIEFTLCP